jgi:hypothetical protein
MSIRDTVGLMRILNRQTETSDRGGTRALTIAIFAVAAVVVGLLLMVESSLTWEQRQTVYGATYPYP